MANDDRQQKSLEILKLINAAATTLRLYPEQTVKVSDSIENAYQGTKSFLRKNDLLRFSLLDGVVLLNGEPVGKRVGEHLKLLTFDAHLQKLKLNEFVLSRGFDRKTFKKMLFVFNATPEQVNKAGGIRAFVEQLGLAAIFPEKYMAPGESEEEQKQKKIIGKVLKELSGGVVRPECVHFLAGKKGGEKERKLFQENLKVVETGVRIIATTTYSLLQILRKDHVVVVSPVFSQMLVKINSFIDELHNEQHKEYAEKAAALIAPHLDDALVLMLICQEFPSPFGGHYYSALVSLIDRDTMTRVVEWMKGQQERVENAKPRKRGQVKAVSSGYERLLDTPRGKQIQAMGATKDILAKTEKGRKEKRLHTGIAALARGDMTSLRNEEVCLSLPSTILKLVANDKEPLAAAIIQNIVSGLKDKDNVLRLSFGQIIGGVAEKLALLKRWDWLEKLTPVCLAWIRETEIADRSFEKHIVAMQAMMNHAWQSEDSAMAGRIVNVFHQVRSGAAGKADAMRKIVAHVQEKNVDLAFLQVAVDNCFTEPFNEDRCQIIVRQGPVAARVLLNRLLLAEKRADRMRLLKVLKGMGSEIVPVLLERLLDRMPWYGKRNIIRLIGETGSEEDVDKVLEYVAHDDLRVQQETLKCIVRIGGESTEKCLLAVLSGASVQMKTEVVGNLAKTAGEEIIEPLAELLEDCKLYSGSEKDALVLKICDTLGKTGSEEALPVLQTVLDGGKKYFGRDGVDAAMQAIAVLQKQGQKEKRSKGGQQEAEVQNDPQEKVMPVGTGPGPSTASYECITANPEEKEVYTLLEKNNKDGAKKKLLLLIEKTAELHKFSEAEALRLRLIDIDPMALTEIIKAAEFIEEAKSNSVDREHTLIWSEIYDLLSSEEASAFYHSLIHEKVEKETFIAKQGEPQRELFLVSKGRVKLYFQEGENEVLVQTSSTGQIFGGRSFFDNSVWTLNAIAMDDVELSILSRSNMEEWQEAFPALQNKLQDYCLRVDRINEFFTTSGAERRVEKRFPLSTPVKIELLDADEDIGDIAIWGDGNDISLGGISFLSRMVRGKDGQILLGRHVRVFIQGDNQDTGKISLTGSIVAVHNLHFVELGHSIHIQFDTNLEQVELGKFIHQ
ncbi:MAG: cyclic nucleotide-binding domain-containing protein [Desulfocapsa sp.]|nr:cyclic nucleotide-binding domain-containing protein [Desulfocapsa sp.]